MNEQSQSAAPSSSAAPGAAAVARRSGQKLGMTRLKFRDQDELTARLVETNYQTRKDGETLKGLIFLGVSHKDGQSGKIHEYAADERVQVWETAGLFQALFSAAIIDGDRRVLDSTVRLRIVHLGKVDLEGGQTVNNYDVFVA